MLRDSQSYAEILEQLGKISKKLESLELLFQGELKKNQSKASLLNEDIDLYQLWIAFWQKRYLILVFTFFVALFSFFVVLSIPNKYKSTVVLAPSSTTDSGSLRSIAGELGGLASLAGIRIGGGDKGNELIAMEVLQSWSFIEDFIKRYHLESEVFAVRGWNENEDFLIYDSDVYDAESKKWVPDKKQLLGEGGAPTSWKLYKRFSEFLSVSQDKKTGFVVVSVNYYSPVVAKEWVNMLVNDVNQKIRQKDIHQATKNIGFLKEQVNETSVVDMRSVFFQLIEEQTKTLMLAKASDDYVFSVISEAKVPEEKSGPRRGLMCLIIIFTGTILLAVGIYINDFVIKKDDRS